MSHYQAGAQNETGYAMNTRPISFAERARSATMDLNGDDKDSMMKGGKAQLLWDKKKHKFVRPTLGADNKKMITTESGAKISASYRSDRYVDLLG
jgi:ATP-dependent RNA helicase DDX54/DBP10